MQIYLITTDSSEAGGDCALDPTAPGYQVFNRISAATQGHRVLLSKANVDKVTFQTLCILKSRWCENVISDPIIYALLYVYDSVACMNLMKVLAHVIVNKMRNMRLSAVFCNKQSKVHRILCECYTNKSRVEIQITINHFSQKKTIIDCSRWLR